MLGSFAPLRMTSKSKTATATAMATAKGDEEDQKTKVTRNGGICDRVGGSNLPTALFFRDFQDAVFLLLCGRGQ